MNKTNSFLEYSYELYRENAELFMFEIEKIRRFNSGKKFGRRLEHLIDYIEKNELLGDVIYYNNGYEHYNYILGKLSLYNEVIKDKKIKEDAKYLYSILDFIKTIVESIFEQIEAINRINKLKNERKK